MTLRLRQPESLTDLLNYRLARLFALGGAPVIRLLEGRYGIARREWRLLATLAVQGALSPSALAQQMQLDRPRTSRTLASVLAKGLVARVATPGDAQQAVVTLHERKRDIAAQLGITPETLSRLLRQLSRKGLIEVRGYTVSVQDLGALRTLASA